MKYLIKDKHYSNTGGNCMVSTFKVWLAEEKRFVWLYLNEEGGSCTAGDYIWDEHLNDGDNWEEYNLFNWSWMATPCDVPAEYCLYIPLIGECLQWHKQQMWPKESYIIQLGDWNSKQIEPDAILASEMIEHLHKQFATTDCDEEEAHIRFYELKASFSFGDKTVTFDNCAAVYNAMEEAMKYIIDNQ